VHSDQYEGSTPERAHAHLEESHSELVSKAGAGHAAALDCQTQEVSLIVINNILRLIKGWRENVVR
jgi:hypothetical protein